MHRDHEQTRHLISLPCPNVGPVGARVPTGDYKQEATVLFIDQKPEVTTSEREGREVRLTFGHHPGVEDRPITLCLSTAQAIQIAHKMLAAATGFNVGDQVESVLVRCRQSWQNAIELGILKPQYHDEARVIVSDITVALAVIGSQRTLG